MLCYRVCINVWCSEKLISKDFIIQDIIAFLSLNAKVTVRGSRMAKFYLVSSENDEQDDE